MPTFNNTTQTVAQFFFSHVIKCFGVPKKLVSDHGTHFQNDMFLDLSCLGFIHELSIPYYLQSNNQVESINHSLKTMLQCIIDHHKTNSHHMLFLSLWVYHKTTKTTIGFTLVHLVHGIEYIIPIKCKIPTLHSALNLFLNTSFLAQRLLHLENLNGDHRASL